MIINCEHCPSSKMYHLMTQTIIPRPIAWVLSDHGNGKYNLAPFSFFSGITSNPPVLAISVGKKDAETKKDTWVNIEQWDKFVVHIPSVEHGQDILASSQSLEHGESEIELVTGDLIFEDGWGLPRLKGPKAAFYCKRYAIYEVGHAPQGLILGEIISVWLDDTLVTEQPDRLVIDALKLDPLARLGGNEYSSLNALITLKLIE